MNHALAHRVEQILRAVRRRRSRIEISPTGDTAQNNSLSDKLWFVSNAFLTSGLLFLCELCVFAGKVLMCGPKTTFRKGAKLAE
jgi:hypothetical protein